MVTWSVGHALFLFPKVILIMVLVYEEKEKAVKLMVNPLRPVEKAIQVSYKKLFSRENMCDMFFT